MGIWCNLKWNFPRTLSRVWGGRRVVLRYPQRTELEATGWWTYEFILIKDFKHERIVAQADLQKNKVIDTVPRKLNIKNYPLILKLGTPFHTLDTGPNLGAALNQDYGKLCHQNRRVKTDIPLTGSQKCPACIQSMNYRAQVNMYAWKHTCAWTHMHVRTPCMHTHVHTHVPTYVHTPCDMHVHTHSMHNRMPTSAARQYPPEGPRLLWGPRQILWLN